MQIPRTLPIQITQTIMPLAHVGYSSDRARLILNTLSAQLKMASNGAESCEGIRKPAIQLRRSRSAVGSRPESRSANRMSSAVKMRERRVKSALESRREQEASAVFPEVKVDLKWGVTKYSEDYCPKKRSTPVPIRPASPTRMNNPHPAQVNG